ncbi:hypothetical protein CVT26_004569 [Gymnopilus dilepis]|uniref:C2H2-type domain-containing protein n=1 Tax=Gymnopilus dilepis TaxID=231916 RepID=A0A409YJ23_9AGAR|nr:hypothetical protein CVT26_004569 [Gymnopilus dilepis]
MSSCHLCSESFSSPDELHAHKQTVHLGSIEFTCTNRTFTVKKQADGCFHCPCPFHTTPAVFHDLETFVAHIEVICAWIEPPALLRSVSSELVDAPVLSQYSFVINFVHHLLLCTTCSVAIVPSQADSHLRNKHDMNLDAKHLSLFHDLVNYFAVSDTFPVMTPPMDAIEGLAVFNGVQCPQCTFASTTSAQLLRHFQDQHPLKNSPTHWPSASVQRLTNGAGSGRSYFAVRVPSDIKHSSNDILSTIVSSCPTFVEDTGLLSEARLLSPWLRQTRWHELLEGHAIEDLRSLAAHPKSNELVTLQPAVYEVFVRASALINATSTLIL